MKLAMRSHAGLLTIACHLPLANSAKDRAPGKAGLRLFWPGFSRATSRRSFAYWNHWLASALHALRLPCTLRTPRAALFCWCG